MYTQRYCTLFLLSTWLFFAVMILPTTARLQMLLIHHEELEPFTAANLPFASEIPKVVFSGRIIPNSCQDVNFTETIIVVPSEENGFDTRIRKAQAKGASGVVMESLEKGPAGNGYYFFDKGNYDDITIPAVEISKSDFQKLMTYLTNCSDSTLVSVQTHEDDNPFIQVHKSTGFLIGVLLIPPMWSCFNLGLILLQIFKAKRSGKLKMSTPIVVICLEAAANFCRLLYFTVDPFNGRHINVALHSILSGVWFPFAWSAIFVVALHWYEVMTHRAVMPNGFLVKTRIPFYIVSAIVMSASFLGLLVGSFVFVFSQYYVNIALIFMASALTGLIIFYLTCGIRVLYKLWNIPSNKAVDKIYRILFKALAVGIIVIIAIFAIIYWEIPFTNTSATAYFVPIMVWYYCLMLASTIQITNVLYTFDGEEKQSGISPKETSEPNLDRIIAEDSKVKPVEGACRIKSVISEDTSSTTGEK